MVNETKKMYTKSDDLEAWGAEEIPNLFFFSFFWIQFNVPFKIISLIETSQSIGGAKREYPGKTT